MLTALDWKHELWDVRVLWKSNSFVGCWFWNKNEGIVLFLSGNNGQVKLFSSFRHLRDKPFLQTDYFQFRYIKYLFPLTEKITQQPRNRSAHRGCVWWREISGNFPYAEKLLALVSSLVSTGLEEGVTAHSRGVETSWSRSFPNHYSMVLWLPSWWHTEQRLCKAKLNWSIMTTGQLTISAFDLYNDHCEC